MPQSTNLNTPPYFEDFDSQNNFHKVLFRPGYPLQARELSTVQSILQNQIENFGSSIYKDGAMVIPGQIGYDLYYHAILIEDEYFGINADILTQYIVGQTIIGNSTGVRARVVNALTSEQSEKGYTTLYVKYLSAGSQNTNGTFADDEILISENSFGIGNTVIQENIDFAKCISLNASSIGSAAKITNGVYFAKGYFVNVKEQEIILDQFNTKPSYKVGLQILEEIVTPEDDTSLTDPSQGYSNYSAPGAHRFKLTAVLTKKSLDDTSVTDFIELLRLEEGGIKEIVNSSKAQIARTLEDTFARRTFDESGDYEVRPYDFSKDECLNNGTNNGIFSITDTTDYGNAPSKDLFEINVSTGKSYVRGYELETLSTTYVDIEKPRTTESINNATIRTDARGVEFRIANSSNDNQITHTQLNASLNSVVPLLDSSSTVIGYALMRSYEEVDNGSSDYIVIRLANLKFVSDTTVVGNLKKIRFGGNINYETNTSSGGTIKDIDSIVGTFKPYLFPVYGNSVIKTLQDTKVQNVLTKYVGSIGSTTTISISGRNYYSTSASDYTLRINGDATSVQRTISNITINESGTLQFTYSGAAAPGEGYTLIGPETINSPTVKLVSHKKMRVLKLTNITNKYSINDAILSLGATRVSKIHAIYNINLQSYQTQDVLPKLTLNAGGGVFTIGEVFVGKSSGAKARLIKQDVNTMYFTYISQSNFLANEEIFGFSSASVATINAINYNGSPDIKTRYKLDDGQRDQTFEFSTISKVSTDSVISGDLIVVFDYFADQLSSGQFYTVNSYYDADFDDIPYHLYDGQKYYLSDHIDWRINQSSAFTVSSTGEYNNPFLIDASQILTNTNLLSYGNSNYLPSSEYLIPIGTTDADLEYYVGRIDDLYLDKNGKFINQKGAAALNPKPPSDSLSNAMKVLSINMPPYVRSLDDIVIKRFSNKRYTMKDIGNLEQRINNIEYYTQLSLLETDTANLFIDDGTGSNRLKNGFLVDNFTSHNVGFFNHPNYQIAMDMGLGEMRPPHYTTNVALKFEEVPSNYLKGDLIMLDYTEKVLIEQPFAAVVENVNPFAVVSWVGLMQVFPASDDWIDEERLPESLTEVEGDYAATAFQLGIDRNTGFAPIEWGAWQTQWSSSSSSSSTTTERSAGGGPPIRQVTTTSSSTTTFQTRSGIRTRVTPRVDRKVLGDRVVDTKYAFWKRSRNVAIHAFRLKPGIRVYPFFDGRDVNAYVTPELLEITMAPNSVQFLVGEDIQITGNVNRKFKATVQKLYDSLYPVKINPYTGESLDDNSSYSQTSTLLRISLESINQLNSSEYGGFLYEGDTIVGLTSGATAVISSKKLVADDKGNLFASFYIPDPNDEANPRWKVGNSVFRLTDSPINSQIPGIVDSSAEANYTASGTIFTKQQDTLLVRNAEIVRDTVSDSRIITSSSSSTRTGGWYDPLAQSFLIEEVGGCFITSVEVYFRTKDTTLPITMQIREMVNGYPSPEVLGTINKLPSDVFISENATASTKFTFNTPIYLAERKEYCFVLLTSSVEYKVWLSEMGKEDLSGERISKQPYAGVLFKSQNASTWTTAELQDFKFKIYRASFNINETPTIKFVNDNDGTSQFTKLRRDPIELNVNSGRIKVNHRNHGLYDPASYVEIKGVSSEEYAILGDDWDGTPGTSVTVVGNRDAFAYASFINGAVPSDSNPGYLKIGDIIYSYNPNGGVTAATNGVYQILTIARISGTIPSSGFKTSDEWLVENYVVDGVPLTFINTIHSNLEWITLDSYQINLSSVTRTSGANSTIGGENVFASQNIQYTQFLPMVSYKELPGTSVLTTFSGTTGTSIGNSAYSNPTTYTTPNQKSYIKDNTYYPIVLNENNELSVPYTMASKINEEKQMIDAKSFSMHVKLESNVENLSPIIDKDRISIITTNNRVADFNGAVDKEYFFNAPDSNFTDIGATAVTDYNPANYITKLASLANECTALRIDFAAFNPSECDIDVYVKILTGEEEDQNSVEWIKIPQNSNYEIRNEITFIDYSYEYEMPAGESFSKYSVKLRLRSRNSALVPIIKDLRCIALA